MTRHLPPRFENVDRGFIDDDVRARSNEPFHLSGSEKRAGRPLAPTVRESRTTVALLEALGCSLDLRVVLERAYPLLLELVPADYGAVGVSPSGRAEDFEWIVARMPPAFFAAYPHMAGHDFVRQSVLQRPNVVLRDDAMVERSALEKNAFYRHARDVGVPLEHVMAVMLHVDDRWQSGLSLYREKRRPFSARECATLERLTPAIARAVRHCHLFGAAVDWAAGLEAALKGRSGILIAPPTTEVARTQGATALIEKWFSPHDGRVGHLPEPLVAFMQKESGPCASGSLTWRREGCDDVLQVFAVPLAGHLGKARTMLILEEHSRALPIPGAWTALLTAREQEVTSRVLRGWDNRLIASDLGCFEVTVKKHLQHVFDKLGIASRTALVAKAATLHAG